VSFNKLEHIVPKSLVNSELILKKVVCDLCNGRFGSTLDSVFTQREGKNTFFRNLQKIILSVGIFQKMIH